jgi:spore germination protein PE
MSRVSSVGHIRIIDIGITAVFEIGDSQRISPVNQSIAVQREKAVFIQNEFNFRDYAIFSRPIPEPVLNEEIRMTTINESEAIGVQNIEFLAVSGAAVIHIGSSEELRADTRIKNIRHLLRERPEKL